MEEHMHKKDNDGMYAIAIAMIVSVIILSGVLVYAANSVNSNLVALNGNIQNLKLNVNVQGGGTQLQGTPTPTAAPTTAPSAKIDFEGLKIPMKGKADAKITIVEFSDFQCPYCEKFFGDAYPQIIKNWVDTGKAKLYFMHFPLNQIHPFAQKAAEAAECAKDQGKFWEMHDKLFQNQGSLGVDSLKKYAADLKLDTAKFNACLDGSQKAPLVANQEQLGIANGIEGTPGFLINGQYVRLGASPYDAFNQVLSSVQV